MQEVEHMYIKSVYHATMAEQMKSGYNEFKSIDVAFDHQTDATIVTVRAQQYDEDGWSDVTEETYSFDHKETGCYEAKFETLAMHCFISGDYKFFHNWVVALEGTMTYEVIELVDSPYKLPGDLAAEAKANVLNKFMAETEEF